MYNEKYADIRLLAENAYAEGKQGNAGYPLDVDAELQAFAKASGIPLERVMNNALLPRLIGLLNHFYTMGQQYAQQGGAV